MRDDFNLPGWAIVLVLVLLVISGIALEMAAFAAKAWIFKVVLGK